MKFLPLLISVLYVLGACDLGLADEIGWPEAVGRLAGERSKAETCIALMKKYGDNAQIARGKLVYADAKSSNDSLVSGLVAALALDETPETLPNLETQLRRSTEGLAEFCNSVSDLIPDKNGNKGIVADVVTAAIEPLLNSLTAGIGSLYNNYREDDALTRKTIQTQLEAAKWPDFIEVKAAD